MAIKSYGDLVIKGTLTITSKQESAYNSVTLEEGVLVYVTDTKKVYIGDGATVFSSLTPLNPDVYDTDEIDDKFDELQLAQPFNIVSITADTTANINTWYMVDLTSATNITITLPSAVVNGDTLIVQDVKFLASSSKTITVTSSGTIGIGKKSVATTTDTMILDIPGIKVYLNFNSNLNSWDITHEQLLSN
jgi:hypothetical protein